MQCVGYHKTCRLARYLRFGVRIYWHFHESVVLRLCLLAISLHCSRSPSMFTHCTVRAAADSTNGQRFPWSKFMGYESVSLVEFTGFILAKVFSTLPRVCVRIRSPAPSGSFWWFRPDPTGLHHRWYPMECFKNRNGT